MARQVAPENVVGRDKLIKRIWKTLKRSSIVFTAERRVGKTTVMKKMKAEPADGTSIVFMDLEKVDSPVRFVEVLLSEIKSLRSRKDAIAGWFGGFVKAIGGTEVAGVIKLPAQDKRGWQPILEETLTSVCEHQNSVQIVFMFDELPYMLQKISVREKPQGSTENAALAILDSLRAMRQENANLRMIFAGSVGLHHVVAQLRGTDYASQPINDMDRIEIEPLAQPDALAFAVDLLKEDGVPCDSRESVARKIVELTDRIPFYIERIISRLALAESEVTGQAVEREIQWYLTNDADPWEMEHFRRRIDIYYSGNIDSESRNSIPVSKVVKTLLNNLAAADEPRSIDDVNSAVKATLPLEDRDLIIKLLGFLARDHYLVCDDQKRYSFRFPLIQKWWLTAQGLNT